MSDLEGPRRNQVNKWTPAEQAIGAALEAVEAMPADDRLSDAVVLLKAASESVADFIDGIKTRRIVSAYPDDSAAGSLMPYRSWSELLGGLAEDVIADDHAATLKRLHTEIERLREENAELKGEVKIAVDHLRKEIERRENCEKESDGRLTTWVDCVRRLRNAEHSRDGLYWEAAKVKRLRDQAISIRTVLSDAGLNAAPLVQSVGLVCSQHAEMQWGLKNIHTLARRAMNAPTDAQCREKLPHILRICEQQSPMDLGGNVLRDVSNCSKCASGNHCSRCSCCGESNDATAS